MRPMIDKLWQNKKQISFLIVISVASVSLNACKGSIEEREISSSKQEQKCNHRTDWYESATDSYERRLDSSTNKTGKTIDPGELSMAVEESRKLAPYLEDMREARESKEFWCEKVEPNSTVYVYNGVIYLNRSDAEFARETD